MTPPKARQAAGPRVEKQPSAKPRAAKEPPAKPRAEKKPSNASCAKKQPIDAASAQEKPCDSFHAAKEPHAKPRAEKKSSNASNAEQQTADEICSTKADAKQKAENIAPENCRVYILRCADGTLYTGWTNDLTARVAAHNAGRGAKYTRGRLPVRLVYSERVAGKGEALRRECALKRLTREEKQRLILENKDKVLD